MAYDQQTLTTMRLLDCELSRHQLSDTLGDHLSGIEKSLASISDLIKGETETTDAANILAALQAIAAAINSLTPQIANIVTTQTAQSTQIGNILVNQTAQNEQLNFIVQVLNRLQSNPVPLPPSANGSV